MGFAGNLSTLSLEEVFQTINRIRGTGVLRLASSEAGRDVVFKDGEIIGVSFRQGEERMALLRRLILQGRINATDAAAISSAARDGAAVIEALISRGMISAEEARDGIRQQSEDELFNLCTWPYADFVFHDAGPNEPDANDLVEHFAPHALTIGVNSLLMESARRHDEWARIKAEAPGDDAVLGSAADREPDLAARGAIYPGSAVVPLIDGVRTTADIVRDSVVTRLDVLEILVDLKHDGLIAELSREDILSHADWRLSQSDFINAARLYRRALATQPDDKAVHTKLAEALEGQGENPEAAGCFSQLALGWLAENQHENALSAALRATSLAANDPLLRMILVRCLLAQGEKDEAIAELGRVEKRFQELGQLEDARSTCLKILDIDPDNAAARATMAHIFSGAEGDQDSEDVVVCSACGHINDREAPQCAACQTDLRLTCACCQRIVAVSDKLCIFCGGDPHGDRPRQSHGSPGTSRISSDSRLMTALGRCPHPCRDPRPKP